MSNTNNINNINLKDIQTKVDGLHKIDDLDEKLEVIKNVKSELEDYQSKINKFKSEIENEDNYNIDEKFKHMSFQELKNIFENEDLFTFEIKVDKESVAKSVFSGNWFQTDVRYAVNIREIIPEIIDEIQKTFSRNDYTTTYGQYDLKSVVEEADFKVD